jgi:hypothetical protein
MRIEKNEKIPNIHYLKIEAKGHQPEFDRFFHKFLPEIGFVVTNKTLKVSNFLSAAPLFCSWLDRGSFETIRFLFVAVLRSIFGRKSVALFFRPNSCFNKKIFLSRFKRYALTTISRLPGVNIISIVPYGVYPQAEKVSTNWIYDPQLWDLETLGVSESEGDDLLFLKELIDQAKGRKIVVSLGTQNRSKGFDCFSDIWCKSEQIRNKYLFIAAGKIFPKSEEEAHKFEKNGGLIVNRRIKEAELFFFYKNADFVWSCYSEEYNQSSGIHGRAVQLGVPVIVREGSFVETLGKQIGHPSLSTPFTVLETIENLLKDLVFSRPSTEETQKIKNKMKEHSMEVFRKAFS